MTRTKTGKVKVKKGDIVFLNGWGGIIGRVVSYERKEKELTLEWPEAIKRLAKFGKDGIQSFRTVEEDQINVLTPNELFERISLAIIGALEEQKKAIVHSIDKAIYNDFRIF